MKQFLHLVVLVVGLAGSASGQVDVPDPSSESTSPQEEESARNLEWVPFKLGPLESIVHPQVWVDRHEDMKLVDRLWQVPVLHRNPDNPLVQEVRIIGRYHGQYADLQSSDGDWSDWENRRQRLGIVVDFLTALRVRLQGKSSQEGRVTDTANVEDLWLGWRRVLGSPVTLKIGQFKPLWSFEWSLSSNLMPTFERSQFVNQFHPERALGASAAWNANTWQLSLAAFKSDIDDSSTTADGWFAVLNVGRELEDDVLGWSEVDWRVDYVNNQRSEVPGSSTRHLLSSSFTGHRGPWAGVADLMYTYRTSEESHAVGVTLLTTRDLVRDRLQLATRYTISAASDKALTLQSRYEVKAPDLESGLGDMHQAVYAGLNWFLHGQKAKLMTGAEYSMMDDLGGTETFRAWTFLAGFRVWF